tara:strand:+ start:4924 stop:5343 length:420 start_codon:yes stop_codon:yes gene_type:complete
MSTRDRDRDEAAIEVANLSIIRDGRHFGKIVEVYDLHYALLVGSRKGVKYLTIQMEQSSDWDCVQTLADEMSKADWQVLRVDEIDKLLERWGKDDPELEAELCLELAEQIIEWSKNVRCVRDPFNRNTRTVGWYTIHCD